MGDKLSTEDILASIRGGGSPAKESVPAEPASEAASEAEASTPEETAPADKPATPGPAPTGTASILDSIRSGGAGDADKPAAAPSSTADILAAARSGGAKPTGGDAKPAGGAAPAGTAGILASIRGGAGGAAAAPAAKKAPARKAAPAVDEAEVGGLSATELNRAARAGQSPEEAEVKPVALPSKPLKGKVAKPAAKKAAVVPRRGFLGTLGAWVTSPLVLAWTSFCASVGVASLATARFMMPNVLVEPPTKFKIGPPSDYSPGTVSTKWKAQFGVWIVNAEVEGVPMVYALSTVCTHLGCTPNWLEGEQKFKCPCHGSGFRKTGVNFEGPAPRPLERMGIRLAPDGMLEVDKSVKFQQELGQWENPASYVPVV